MMPAPSWIPSQASSLYGGLLSSVAGGLTGSVLNPVWTMLGARAWQGDPTMPPPAFPAIDAYMRGMLSEKDARSIATMHGLDWSINYDPKKSGSAQRALYAITRAMQSVPGPDVLTDMHFRGMIDDASYARGMVRANADADWWSAYQWAFMASPGVGELAVALNREIITPEQWGQELRMLGVRRQRHVEMLDALRFSIPGPGDLIRFAVREAFKPELANPLKYYHEYPAFLDKWLKAHGLHGELGFEVDTEAGPVPATWGRLHWASHWNPLAPGQSFDLLHRVRPSRLEKYKKLGLDLKPFTLDDVRFWLRVNDYPPTTRDYLAALSYFPLNTRDIRNAIRLGVYTKADANEAFQDRGYHPDDAETLTSIAVRMEEERQKRTVLSLQEGSVRKAIAAVERAYETGVISRDQAQQAFFAQVIFDPAASMILDAIDLKVNTALVRSVITATRADFLDGTLSHAEAVQSLVNAGVVQERVNHYLQIWVVTRSRRRRTLTTGQIIKEVREGLLSSEEAKTRLANLGWDTPDTLLLLADAAQQIARVKARQEQALQRSQRSRAAELERLSRAQDRLREKFRADLRRITPRATLVKWLKLRLIGPKRFRSRMEAMGYPDDVISRYAAEAVRARSNGKAKTPPPPAPPEPPGTAGPVP